MSQFFNNSIFWIEVDKIKPNPFQPRTEFDETRLKDLADSIRMYGVLQPLVITRREIVKEDAGIVVEYELISGERRLRASRLAGLSQVPALIRATEDSERVKLELAIIENLQREDLNAVERARAFDRLANEFKFKHTEIAEKVGKSREYVSNTLRILMLPEDILNALSQGKLSEGHTRPLMMLQDRKEEQTTLFKEILMRKMNVREAESIARRIAIEKARRKDNLPDQEMLDIEEKLTESLGTRVQIERKNMGGKLVIDFFSKEDLQHILDLMNSNRPSAEVDTAPVALTWSQKSVGREGSKQDNLGDLSGVVDTKSTSGPGRPVSESDHEEKVSSNEDDEDLYSIENFTV